MKRRILVPTIASFALLAYGCGDAGNRAAPLDPEVSASSAAPPTQLSEVEALRELTRAFAVALQDETLRSQVKRDLRASHHTTEHKLPFTAYLRGMRGRTVLAGMAGETGRSDEEILALLAIVRPLEFYMPVPQHREAWLGGDNVIVASLLDDETVAPAGFDLQGAPVALSADTPPETPTLALVPVETNFSEELDVTKYRNRNDSGGESIGTLTMEPDPCSPESPDCGGGGGGGGSTTKTGGLYMTYSYIPDLREAWAKGAPEIEAHIHGPNSGDKTYGADLSCAGERQTEVYRNFNQDDNSWSGEVLLFTQAQITDFNSKYGEGFNLMLWEDDDTACTIKTDKDMTEVLKLIAGSAGAAALIIAEPTSTSSWLKAVGTFIGAVYASASWLKSSDDFVGAAPQVTDGSIRSDLWVSGSSKNGYIDTSTKYMQ